MLEVLAFATVLAPVITALTELVKRTALLPKNFIPLVSFIIGLGVGWAAYPFTELELVLRLWSGGLAGLAATGLFELGKTSIRRTK